MKFLLILLTALFFSCGGKNENGSIKESGAFEAVSTIVSASNGDRITAIFKDEGDRLNKGDTVLIIDPETLEIKLKQAEAALSVAKAKQKMLVDGARKEDLKLAALRLSEAESAFGLAAKNEARMKKLLASKSITQKQYDDVKTQLDIAESKVSAARAQLKRLKNFARPEELQQALGNVNAAEANVALLKKNIRNCYVVSPIDGILVERYVELGETAMPGSALFKAADLSLLKLTVYVKETDLAKIKLGDDVDITVDSSPDVFKGKVSYISPEAEFTPKTIQTKDERTKLVYKVKIKVENPDLKLKDGMPADAVIKIEE
ncbi:MAG: HlyD family efflux transporter periplasmic adaptor subunit [Chlorobi bacterium]|nr:HlyD family efflux transporter periplasmic adaptor subunit [Chlorobiota bacterium]